MKGYSRVLAAVALLFSIFFSGWLNRAQAEGRPVPRAPSSSSSTAAAAAMASTSRAVRDLQVDKKHPYKQVDSSFRRIPPSRSNPTQNKCKPPLDG